MFHHQDKPAKPLPAKLINELVMMTTPAEFLTHGKRSVLTQDIEQLSAIEPAYYDAIGTPLLHTLIHYCQQLPETSNSYYALPGGLVDFALNRTQAALQLFRQYLILSANNHPSAIQQLWLYALLSASMLQDIGKLQIDYTVNTYNAKGQPIKTWNALHGKLYQPASYYQFQFEPDHEDKTILRQRINLLLAHAIMPKEGFDWIASHPEVLAAWLALLSDDWHGAGTLGAILIRANAIAIQRYFNEHLLQHVSRQNKTNARVGSFIDTTPEANNIAKDQMVGVEFIKWLTAALESGALVINESPLLMVPAGLLINPEAFKIFLQQNPLYKNWQTVQRGFLSLDLHQNSPLGDPITRYEQNDTHQMYEGILFEQYAIALPPSVSLQNLHTGKVNTLSAIEFVHLAQHNQAFTKQGAATPHNPPQHLTVTGQWTLPPHNPTATNKAGHIASG